MEIRAPERAILGRDTSVEISLKPLGNEQPVLAVNTGQISQPKLSGGRLRATYTPPEELFPHVAIIAVLDRERSLLDWIALPLYGETEIDTKTDPGASVIVRIGGTDFGPAKADQKGRATIPVAVPPGFDKGTTIATDRLGNSKTTTFGIDVIPFNRVFEVCPRTGIKLVVIVVDKRGRPEENGQLALGSTEGELQPAEMIAPGVYEALLTTADTAEEGREVTLDATIKEDPASQDSCTVLLRRATPSVAPPVALVDSGVSDERSSRATAIALGPKVGLATNFGGITSALFAVDSAVRPPILRQRLYLGIEVLVYWDNSEQRIADAAEQSSISVWAIPLLIRGAYRIPAGPVVIYPGVAAGVSVVGTEISSENDGRVTTRGLCFSVSGLLGAEMSLGPGRIVIEAAFLYTPSETSTVRGNLGGFMLTGGYRFEFWA